MAAKEETVYTNPNRNGRITEDESSDVEETKDSQSSHGIVGIFSQFADKCSVSGMPFITQAENQVVRVIWSFLLFAAFGLMTFHLYQLISTYFEYKKQTEVQLSFSNLQFPAVTVCNTNPMRMSQVHMASQELRDFITSVDPDSIRDFLEKWTPELEVEEVEGEYESDATKKRRKRQVGSTKVKEKNVGTGKSKEKRKLRKNNFFDDINIARNNIRKEASNEYFLKNEQKTWEAESDSSGVYELEQKFRALLALESSSFRSQMGHQIHDMLLQCSFAGRTCIASNFTRSQTAKFGNCYTLQYHKFISRESGPSEGLQLQFFLETDDYVPGIANSKGIEVIIHDQGTLAFPEDEGVAVAAGTETFIGLRRVEVARLGSPYGECTPIQGFKEKYGVKYTRKACQRICRQAHTRERCGCYDNMEQEVDRVLKRPKDLRPCQTNDDLQCVLNIASQFQRNNDMCDCFRPCQETTFERTISSRNWPNPAFAALLSVAACKHNISACSNLETKRHQDLREEFVRLVIYYEDLNYEELKESADYELDQFLSDVGGTIGLWIGLSLLSLCEIFHLITAILIYICCQNAKSTDKSSRPV